MNCDIGLGSSRDKTESQTQGRSTVTSGSGSPEHLENTAVRKRLSISLSSSSLVLHTASFHVQQLLILALS